jgi:hypothetical protein
VSFAVTVIQSLKPPHTGKEFFVKPDGTLGKRAVASIRKGVAHTREARTAEDMKAIVEGTTRSTNQALCLSSFKGAAPGDPPIRIVIEDMLMGLVHRLRGPDATIDGSTGFYEVNGHRYAARLKRCMAPSVWALLETDNPEGMPDKWLGLALAERLKLLEAIIPGISTRERVEYRGSSARVVNDSGAPAPEPTHALVRVSDPAKIEVLRQFLRVQAVLAGLSFETPRRSRETGEVIGREHRTLIDLAVLVDGRLIFNATPRVSWPGYSAIGAGVRIVNAGAGALDLSRVAIPGEEMLDAHRKKTGVNLSYTRTSDGLVVEDTGQLKENTEIEVRGVVKPLSAWLESMRAEGKNHLRCEAPFRATRAKPPSSRSPRMGVSSFTTWASARTTT